MLWNVRTDNYKNDSLTLFLSAAAGTLYQSFKKKLKYALFFLQSSLKRILVLETGSDQQQFFLIGIGLGQQN